jgi:UDPglucose 6-dehydrogenase
MVGRTVVDLRNAFDADAARSAGFDYSGIGRGNAYSAELEPQTRAAATDLRTTQAAK